MGESLGKKGKGINSNSFLRHPKDHHSLMQLYVDGPRDKFFTIFTSDDNMNCKVSNKFILNKFTLY